MARISREQMLMQVAGVVASRGTCSRLQVGAVIAREGRILSTGYNGAPAGAQHCNHECNCGDERLHKPSMHFASCPASPKGCEIAVHAELNAIAYAARYGIATDRAELFCTHSPCPNCAFAIVNAGIFRVTYQTEYRKKEAFDILSSAGISYGQI